MVDPGGEIAVLLVDDDVEWVRTAGTALESEDDALSVITATGGWEALDLLEEVPVDCVVCDYRMPDFDGITLLERIRAEDGDVPFILITGSGSETVASRAISSRVTDYFIKDPGRDQSRALAMRIRRAVQADRTGKALEAARQRFTELFERVPDPVAITDEAGTLLATNDAFAHRFGADPGDLADAPIDAVVEGLDAEAADAAADDAPVRRLTADTNQGEREFLVRAFPLERPGVTEVGHVFTDVTRQRDRERELERFYELSADVRELVLSAESRAELERTFCELVVGPLEDAVALLARGVAAEDLTVRATAGDVDDRLERALFDPGGGPETDDADPDGEHVHPVASVCAGEPARRVVDVSSIPADWAIAARSRGIREVLALPVERDGVPTGVFVVCAAAASTLDDRTIERLAALVDSLGDAMDVVDRATALAADQVVRVRLTVGDAEAVLNGLSSSTGAALEVASAIPREDGTALYVTLAADGEDALCTALDASTAIDGHEVIASGERVRVRADATAPTVPGTLADQPVAVRSIRVADGRTRATVDVPLSGDVRAVVEALEDRHDAVSVTSIRTVEPEDDEATDAPALDALTDKQRRAVETAVQEGYFERPRARTADEVAATLDISRSTFLQHLRAAERKLLSGLLSWDADDRRGS